MIGIENFLKIKKRQRDDAIREAALLRSEFYSANKELDAISQERANLQYRRSMKSLGGDDVSEENKLIEALGKKEEAALKTLGKCEEDFKPKFMCSICEDTGYDGDEVCKCVTSMMAKYMIGQYEKHNTLKYDNFDKFDLSLFSDEPNIETSRGKVSQRDLMRGVRESALDFVESYPNEKSLLFVGGPGLGKTFTANCISDGLLKKGYYVLYYRFTELQDLFRNYTNFNKSDEVNEDYAELFSASLLVIDDLNIPQMNAVVDSLFEVVDKRMARRQSTIITTNLSKQEILENYGARIHSRLREYKKWTFKGKDLRGKLGQD